MVLYLRPEGVLPEGNKDMKTAGKYVDMGAERSNCWDFLRRCYARSVPLRDLVILA